MNIIANAYDRSQAILRQWFPSAFGGNTKHDYYRDFGWPEQLSFDDFYRAYTRSGMAASAVDKTISKTWETMPVMWESEKPSESRLEAEVRQHFDRYGIWRGLIAADRRSLVGRYAGAILVLRDGKPLSEPVDRVHGGIHGLAAVIPAWEGQLSVSEWVGDMSSDDYGKPSFYQFDEQAVGHSESGARNSVRIHSDRIIIFSEDGTVGGRSALEAGYNDIIDAEKVKGAGGEGFWKSSRGTPVIQAPQGVSPQEIMRGMDARNGEEVIERLNEQVDNVASGFDKAYMFGGFSVSTLAISLPQPKQFWEIPAMSFASSMGIPFKIMVGNISGERSSTEDLAEWNQTNMARRESRVKPQIHELIDRLVAWGVLPKRDWTIGWDDLAEATEGDKLDRASKMADVNAKSVNDIVFLPDEIREAAGYEASGNMDGWDEFMIDRADDLSGRADDLGVVESEGVG